MENEDGVRKPRKGRKGDCGGTPRVGKSGDAKPSRGGRGAGRGAGRSTGRSAGRGRGRALGYRDEGE